MVIRHVTSLLGQDEVSILLSSAGTAPSMHNTQPWRFEVSGPVVDVLLDDEGTLPAEDRSGRLVRIGIGAAAFNLRVAAAALGHETTIAIDPDQDRPDLAVRIFLGARQPMMPPLGGLYGELRRRRTFRGPLMSVAVAPRVLALVADSARADGVDLRWLTGPATAKLTTILRTADDLDLHDEGRLAERRRWIGGDRAEDGVPAAALGPLAGRPAAIRDLAAGFDDQSRSAGIFEQKSHIGVITTTEDDTVAWTRAGMALQHALLTATSYDLAASFLNQAIEYMHLRARVQDLVGRTVHPQMILRVGYPTQPTVETPRKPWQSNLRLWQ
jgi:nitroreductase